VHTKKRNRLEATKRNNLVYVQFNANLIEKNKKRKTRGHEVLLADDASGAQEWIVENDEVTNDVDLERGADEELGPRTSARLRERELYKDNFESESEDHVDEEVEYESDGVEIIEQYGQRDDQSSIY
nr:zinc finger, BED-type [Tanacetum cinerariifolium]